MSQGVGAKAKRSLCSAGAGVVERSEWRGTHLPYHHHGGEERDEIGAMGTKEHSDNNLTDQRW